MTAGVTRREMLWRLGNGLGGIALAELLGRQGLLAAEGPPRPRPEFNGGLHHPAKARRVIQIFLNGGMSQMDTFDYKPELEKRHGQPFDPGGLVEAATSKPGPLMKCPFPFKQHGESGRWVSDVFPHLAGRVDDMAFVMAMASRSNVHGPASYLMNTGFLMPGFPCLGAWVSYGLGAIEDNLPSFVVLPDPKGLPYNAKGNFTSGFLPPSHQGTILDLSLAEPVPDLYPPSSSTGSITKEGQRDGLALLEGMNRDHAASRPGDARLESRIESYELAARLQLSAPEALDLGGESEWTRRLYGLDEPVTEDFGRRLLIARRFLERGVRFVQVWSGAGGPKDNWDNHTDILGELPAIARTVDKPTAGLLLDLKARGLMDDTLVVWSTEFGRMPFTQGSTGRDHNGGTSVAWMAGAGIEPGSSQGESDPWAWKAAIDRTTGYDLHATILHLLGIDHTLLTVRHNGINRRLTDVHGHVIESILA